jgi:hypothetical protein
MFVHVRPLLSRATLAAGIGDAKALPGHGNEK